MRQLKRLATSAAWAAVAAAPAAMIALAGTAAAAPVSPTPGPTTSPTPNANAATQVQLGKTNENCNFTPAANGEQGTGTGSGFVIVNTTGSNGPNGLTSSNKVAAEVDLTNAAPNTTYDVNLIQLTPNMGVGLTCPAGTPGVVDGTIHTDASGDGNVNLEENVVPNATRAWVQVLNPANATDYYTSATTAGV